MKKFLNTEMEMQKSISDEGKSKLKKAFKNSVTIVHSLLGDKAFRKFDVGNAENHAGLWAKKFNASLFEILMWSFADKDRNLLMDNLDSIKEELIDLMSSNSDFISSIEVNTSHRKTLRKRFKIGEESLEKILENKEKQPRCFSRELKNEFYEKNPTCKICGNNIVNIDDAAMDHIDQYWRGGQTIPENARLVHRYCNNARPRNDR